MSLDAHERPPETLRLLMKRWKHATQHQIDTSPDVLDASSKAAEIEKAFVACGSIHPEVLRKACERLMDGGASSVTISRASPVFIFEVEAMPGLCVYPSLLSTEVQVLLLNKLLHRDLSNRGHRTNLHLHHDIIYPSQHIELSSDSHAASFFRMDSDTVFQPRDPSIHKPLTVKQMLERKLRWITLGGQYDWTAKAYPSGDAPQFPSDVGSFLREMWPKVDAQAAIVNLYSPGDTLSLHRDVSEECDRALISISIGCDALFVVGNQDGSQHATLRLHSGDALLMSGQSRFAWHAVPKILPDTCPTALQNWPVADKAPGLDQWKNWLANKRINLNVRQMYEAPQNNHNPHLS